MKCIHLILFAWLWCLRLPAQQTEKLYLSGTGSDDTKQWDFFCTAGMNAGKWTTIPVPSCWELQGFGKYDYGFAKDSVRGKEKGLYKYSFNIPAGWRKKTVNLVFEGSMTDTQVKINGASAGPIHQGAFYVFKYDITDKIKPGGQNLLEVTVSKHSANQSVNEAERKADFWIFGGIFRPVYLEAIPATHIEAIQLNARADGSLSALVNTTGTTGLQVQLAVYDASGKLVGKSTGRKTGAAGDNNYIVTQQFSAARLWSPEFPNLYKAVCSLYEKGILVHTVSKKFGFRTVEVKQRDGIYVNGVKMKMKGVNRHSFWPTSGRTTNRTVSIDDILLMKEMNMNAVRMSHYPPDEHFLDACDSLGLFVMDELAGWHGNYDTPTGTKLLKEMIDHDVNHPSIILWSNGNEGGHNLELDHLFAEYDVQKRPVVHPWQLYGGIETQHYREYNYGIGNYENGREIVMPTEFLHGQFDGGHGAGLEDYWEKMWRDPLSAGGFLWDFADQAVVRKDLQDSLDTDKFRAADGIVGPYHQKEGSFYAIKEIWSPVYFEKRNITPAFDGLLNIENRYAFTNTNQCRFSWKLKKFGPGNTAERSGIAPSPSIKPFEKGHLKLMLPQDWTQFDALYVTVNDRTGLELFTWSFPIHSPGQVATGIVQTKGDANVQLKEMDSAWQVAVNDVSLTFSRNTGMLLSAKNSKGELPFNNGPVLQEGAQNFKEFRTYFEGKNLVIASVYDKKDGYNTMEWTVYPSGWVKLKVRYFPAAYFTNFVGINFSFPETAIKSVTYLGYGPYRVWKNRMKGNSFGVWSKPYNNTETGEFPWVYPEFKGYHAGFYGGYFCTRSNRFTVMTETEDIFLRLFTPAWKTDQWHNYEPLFPSGDISFMQGISSIGTKTQRNETTGPMGMKNIFYDYEKEPGRALEMILYFNFSAKDL